MPYVLSFLCVIASLALMAVSAAMNFSFLSSVGQSSFESAVFGVASIALDMLKSGLPFFIAWGFAAGKRSYALLGSVGFAMIFAFSLLSAVGFSAGNRGAVTGGRETNNAELAAVRRDLTAADAKLAALEQHRPTAVIEEDIARVKQDRRYTTSNACEAATAAATRDFCQSFFTLRRELAASVEGTRLEADRQRLRGAALNLEKHGAGQDADAQATVLARLLPNITTDKAQLALNVFVAVLVEFCAAFGLFLSTGFLPARQRPAPEAKIERPEPTAIATSAEVVETTYTRTPQSRAVARAVARPIVTPRPRLSRITVGADGSLIVDD